MHIPRFYIDVDLTPGLTLDLQEAHAHHINNVLRMKKDEHVLLFNGDGNDYDATLISLSKKSATVSINVCHAVKTESTLHLILALSIMRGRQIDYALQKAVELGVTEIIPVASEFSSLNLKQANSDKKLRHWLGITQSAAEQCGRTYLPKLNKPICLQDFLASPRANTNIIFHPYGNATDSVADMNEIQVKDNTLCILIGPEGGFSESEVSHAQGLGYQRVRLGPRILRADTAVIAAVTTCQCQWGDLQSAHATASTSR